MCGKEFKAVVDIGEVKKLHNIKCLKKFWKKHREKYRYNPQKIYCLIKINGILKLITESNRARIDKRRFYELNKIYNRIILEKKK